MSESKIMEILTSYSDVFGNVFEINSIFSDIIRSFIWGLIKILAIISNSIEGIIDQIYSLNGFFYSEGVTNLFKKLSPIIWVLLAISIGFIGYKLMFDREFKSEKIIQNILVAIIVVVMLPNLMLQLSNATIEGRKALDEIDETKMSMSANKVIKDNLYDLYYLDEFKFTNKSLKNNLKEDDIKYINICETVSDKKIENKDIFNQKIGTKTNGELELDKLDKTFFGLIKENYYRYKIDYIPVIVTLLCIIIALLSTVFKVSRIIFELGFVGIFGQLLAFSDIATGQKLKEVIKHIINTFIVLFLVSLILKMFLIFSSWLNDNESINMATKLVMLIGATISVVDGPNVIERILGIDSGVKSGWSVVMGGVASTKVAGQTAHTMGKLASNISSKISNLNKSDNKSNKSLNDEMNSMNNSSTDKKDTNESLSDQMRNSDIENESINRNQADSFDSNSDSSSMETDSNIDSIDKSSNESNLNDESVNSVNNSSNLDTIDSNESINRNQNDSFDSNSDSSSLESDVKANNTDNVSSENNINDKSANSINNSSNLDTMDSNESINRNQNDSFDSNNSNSSLESDFKANNTDNVSSENNINDKLVNSINNSSNLDTMGSNDKPGIDTMSRSPFIDNNDTTSLNDYAKASMNLDSNNISKIEGSNFDNKINSNIDTGNQGLESNMINNGSNIDRANLNNVPNTKTNIKENSNILSNNNNLGKHIENNTKINTNNIPVDKQNYIGNRKDMVINKNNFYTNSKKDLKNKK